MAKPFAFSVADSSLTWLSEGTVDATDGLTYKSIEPALGVPTPQRNDEIGVDEEKEPQPGLIDSAEMSTSHLLRYMNFDQIFAAAMGADAVSSPAGGIYQHLHTYVADPTQVCFAAWDSEESGLWSWPGVYVTGFDISGEMGSPVEVSFSYICAQPVIDGSVNDQTVMDAVGYESSAGTHIVRMIDDDSWFRINAQSGGSVAAADEACIKSFNLSFKRNVRSIYCLGDGDEPQQPVCEAFPDVSLNVTFSKQVDGALPESYGLIALAQAGTPLKAELVLRGGTLNASYDAQYRFRFPALTIPEGISFGVDNPYVNELEVPFIVTGASTAPTGFSGLTTYFDIQSQNIVDNDYIS